jgi:hypothetical protein
VAHVDGRGRPVHAVPVVAGLQARDNTRGIGPRDAPLDHLRVDLVRDTVGRAARHQGPVWARGCIRRRDPDLAVGLRVVGAVVVVGGQLVRGDREGPRLDDAT